MHSVVHVQRLIEGLNEVVATYMKRLWYKLRCVLGFHRWLYDAEHPPYNRVCRKCGRWEYDVVI
jgi:hypothetical protein